MEKDWLVPVMAKLDANKELQPVTGHVIARATFGYQAVNVAGEAGYVADGQVREAVDSDREGALAVLPEAPAWNPRHAEDVPPVPFGEDLKVE